MENTIIIDNGSANCKIGMSSSETPQSIFPAVIGQRKYKNYGYKNDDKYVGTDALEKCGTCILNHPNISSNKWNLDDNTLIFNHIFYNELRVDPADHPVLLIEKFYMKKNIRESLAQLLFETYNVPSFCFGEKSTLSLLSTGRNTGIVLHSGNDSTYACPIYEQCPINQSVKISNVSGNEITEYIKETINFRNFAEDHNKRASEGLSSSPFMFNTSADQEIVRDIKEKFSYVALDYDKELLDSQNSTEKYEIYRLPDQSLLTIQKERFVCPEILFRPNTYDDVGVDQLVYNSIMSCNRTNKQDLFKNIVLSGGTTMTEGFSDRFTNEITNLAPLNYEVNVIAPKDRNCAAFRGGVVFTRQPSFKNTNISRDDYNESGPVIAIRKYLHFFN